MLVNPAAPLEGASRLWSEEPMKDMKDMKDEDIQVIYIKVVLAHYRGCFPCRACPAKVRHYWLPVKTSGPLGALCRVIWAYFFDVFLMFVLTSVLMAFDIELSSVWKGYEG